jgi:hypothetical protein
LALVYAWTGERDRALERLQIVPAIPAGPPYGDLHFIRAGILCEVIRVSTRSLPRRRLPADNRAVLSRLITGGGKPRNKK